ncbi:MAG: hypothetical protein Q8R74_08010 [Methylophilus sp.]|jgi:hypothetical protein|nr:hypothetical protein [Methylophilus sp.]
MRGLATLSLIEMKDKEAARSTSNKKIAFIIGAVVFVWYVASIFTVWNP